MRKRNFRKPTQLGLFPAARSPSHSNKIEANDPVGAPKVGQNRPNPSLTVYCDGGCEPNPGAGGWAIVVYRNGLEIGHDFGGIDDIATNNVAELTALLRSIQWIFENAAGEPANVISDSRYVVDGCNAWRPSWKAKGWKRKGVDAKPANQTIANLDLWQATDAALTENPLISLAWCKGRAGILGNLRADELAPISRASLDDLDNPVLALDREYRAIMGGASWI